MQVSSMITVRRRPSDGENAVMYSIAAYKTVLTEGDDGTTFWVRKTVGGDVRTLSYEETEAEGITVIGTGDATNHVEWNSNDQQLYLDDGVEYGKNYTLLAVKDNKEVARLTIGVVKKGADGLPGTNGTNGGYTDYSFGISASLYNPSDVTEWKDAPMAVTSARPYLWTRMIKYDGNGNQIGKTSYARLTGERGQEGTALSIEDTVQRHFSTEAELEAAMPLADGKYIYDWDANEDGCSYIATVVNGTLKTFSDYGKDKALYSCAYDGHLYQSYESSRVWADLGAIRGTSVKAEYHAGTAYPSKESTGWHTPYADGDIWMHIDDGTGNGWGEAVRIVGERGASSVMYSIDVLAAYQRDEKNVYHSCRIYRIEGTDRVEITDTNHQKYKIYPHCKAEEEDVWYDSMFYDTTDGWVCTHGVNTWQKYISVGLFTKRGDASNTDTMYASVTTTLAKNGADGRKGQTFAFWIWSEIKRAYEQDKTIHTFFDNNHKDAASEAYIADVVIVDPDTHEQYVCIKTYTYGIAGQPNLDPNEDSDHWQKMSWMENLATDMLLSDKMYARVLQAVNARIDDLIVRNLNAMTEGGQSYVRADGKTGIFTARNAHLSHCTIEGSMRNPWRNPDANTDGMGGVINAHNQYDNLLAYNNADWDKAQNHINWNITDNGRLIRIAHIPMDATIADKILVAPPGKYIFEDGLRKSQITISNEVIEMIGYGNANQFYGYIILRRTNILSPLALGKDFRILAQGRITTSWLQEIVGPFYQRTIPNTIATTFDGQSLKLTKTSSGNYILTLPDSWSDNERNFSFQATPWALGNGVFSLVNINSIAKRSIGFSVMSLGPDGLGAGVASFEFVLTNKSDWH